MKVGIITSWVDMLVLFRFLSKHDLAYEIFYDDLGRPWGDKPLEFVKERASKWIEYLTKRWCDKIIVPPLLEVAFHHDKKHQEIIFPLRIGYAQECMSGSPVGKIWLAGEYVDIEHKNLFEQMLESYKPNVRQQERVQEIAKKKPSYEWTISFWRKEITMWKYYLTKLSFKSQIVHHAMKADRKYFKDAWVDTIIPTNYGFFAYEVALWKFICNTLHIVWQYVFYRRFTESIKNHIVFMRK